MHKLCLKPSLFQYLPSLYMLTFSAGLLLLFGGVCSLPRCWATIVSSTPAGGTTGNAFGAASAKDGGGPDTGGGEAFGQGGSGRPGGLP